MYIIERGLIAGIFIIVIVLLRKFLIYRAPKYTVMVLWVIIILRLIMPFYIQPDFKIPEKDFLKNSTGSILSRLNLYIYNFEDNFNFRFPRLYQYITILIIGIYVILHIHWQIKRLRQSTKVDCGEEIKDWIESNFSKRKIVILKNSNIKTPITYGLFKPKIIFPKNVLDNANINLKYILEHELIHIKRFDQIWKIVINIIICVYWFNPLVWVMYKYINRDLEITCDKEVLDKLGYKIKKEYIETILFLSQKENDFKDFASGFGIHPTRERIKAIVEYKKSRVLSRIISVITVLFFMLSFVKSEGYGKIPKTIENYTEEDDGDLIQHSMSEHDILDSYDNESYSFKMNSLTTGDYNQFRTEIHSTSSPGDKKEYKLVITEGGEEIYSKIYRNDINITTINAKHGKKYKITILNMADTIFTYDIEITRKRK